MFGWIDEVFTGLAAIWREYLVHLWPQFALMLDDAATDPRAIAAWFIAFLLAIAAITGAVVTINGVLGTIRIRRLARVLRGLNPEEMAERRRDLLSRLVGKKRKADGTSHVWKEFDDSLVVSRDGDHLYNTLDAEHFFNTHSLARGVTDSRLLAAVPSFLIAIGVLGTFVGLTVGLSGLELGDDADVDALRDGIHAMIAGAAVAFATSVWGVLLSVGVNAYEKFWETWIRRYVARLQDQVDHLFPRLTSEHSLNDIAGSSLESQKALQTLHEKIGEQLQEKLEAAGSHFQQSLVDGIQAVMRESLDKMNAEASQQSTETLEKLVEQFMQRMGETGEEQRKLLDNASHNMQGAVNQLGEQMSSLVSELSQQQEAARERSDEQRQQAEATSQRLQDDNERRLSNLQEQFERLMSELGTRAEEQQERADLRERDRQERMQQGLDAYGQAQKRTETVVSQFVEHQQQHSERVEAQLSSLLEHLESATGSIERSSTSLATGAGHLDDMGQNLQQATSGLQGPVRDMTQRLGEISAELARAESQLREETQHLDGLRQALSTASGEFQESAKLATEGFRALEKHQQEFLTSLSNNFGQVTKTLRDQVEGLEKQAQNWLEAYAEEVSRQTSDRMDEWDKQTRNFADNLHKSVQAIGDVVEEIEGKVSRNAAR